KNFTERGPGSRACRAQIQYAVRYAPLADSIATAHGFAGAPRGDDAAVLAGKVGVCVAAAGGAAAPSTATPFGRYANLMIAAVRRAVTLPQALSAIDDQIARAANDPEVDADALTSIAA